MWPRFEIEFELDPAWSERYISLAPGYVSLPPNVGPLLKQVNMEYLLKLNCPV